MVKIFTVGSNRYIFTAGDEKYGDNTPKKGAIRIWKYGSFGLSMMSNVSWRDMEGKNTTIKDLWLGDADGDGNLELITAGNIEWSEKTSDNKTENYSLAEITAWRVNSDMTLSFLGKETWADEENGTYANSIRCEDYDGDGIYEIVVGGSYGFNDSGVKRSKAQITVWHYSSGAFSLVRSVEWIDNDNCGVMSIVLNDINSDGKDEIIAGGVNKYLAMAGEVSIWDFFLNELARTQFYIDPEGQPGSTHWDCIALALVVGDFDSDGIPDIVLSGLSKGPHPGGDTFWSYLISFNYQSGSLVKGAKQYWRTYDGESIQSMAHGDVNGDGVDDIIMVGYGWKSGSNGEMIYYSMLYMYDYEESVPELSPALLILIALIIPVAWRVRS